MQILALADAFSRYKLDIIVLTAYLGLILWIGLSQRSKSGTVAGFALGDRGTPWWAVMASILAAEISAATFLGAPETGYKERSWVYAQFTIGTIIARVLVGEIFIPLYYRHKVVSLYEYLETRFGVVTRKTASIFFLITRVLALGVRLYVAAIPLTLVYVIVSGTALSAENTALVFGVVLVAIIGLTAIYTVVGGIRAVIWTDFIQVGVLIAALGFTIVFLLGELPKGFDSAWEVVDKDHPFFNMGDFEGLGFWGVVKKILTSEYTMFAALIGSTFVTMSTHGIDQDTVQRMLTAKNRRQSAFATVLSGLLDVPVVCAFIFVGILLYAYYQHFPDTGLPLDAKGDLDTRSIFPYFVLTRMPAGMCGLVIAGVMAAAMGSLSTALNALATSFSSDFIFPKEAGRMTEARKVVWLRVSTVFFALLMVIVGVVTSQYIVYNPDLKIIPLVMGILGYTFGSLLGIFLLAIFTKTRGNDVGNVIAMMSGVGVVLFLTVDGIQEWFDMGTWNAKGIFEPFLILSFPWRITFGTLVTVAVAAMFRTPEAKVRSAQERERLAEAEAWTEEVS